jgi:phage shock protein C
VNTRRLTRCRHDRRIAGVAAGMAEYLDLDPTVVRVAWVLATFLGGFTIPLYIVLAIVMPLEPEAGAQAAAGGVEGETLGTTIGDAARSFADGVSATAAELGHRHRGRPSDGRLAMTFGILLVAFGTIALVGPMVPGWMGSVHLGPAFILALGIALVIGATRRTPAEG